MRKPQRVLPADVYDTLELSALAFGGIGAFRDFDYHDPGNGIRESNANVPLCIWGHALAQQGDGDDYGPLAQALIQAGIGRRVNDEAVEDINFRLGRDNDHRVTFRQWRKQLNVVRGN